MSILDSLGIDVAYVIMVLLVFIIVLLILNLNNGKRIKRLERRYARFMRGSGGKSLETTVLEKFDDIDELKEQNEWMTKQIGELRERMSGTYQKMGLVKYNAFREMGGNLSCALVMLDKENTGFCLNVMHGSEGCYTYVKEIIKGESFIELSEEEKDALQQAVSKHELP